MLQGDSPASSSSSQASKKQHQQPPPQPPHREQPPPTPATRNGGSSRSGTLKRVAFKDEQTVHEDDGASPSTRCKNTNEWKYYTRSSNSTIFIRIELCFWYLKESVVWGSGLNTYSNYLFLFIYGQCRSVDYRGSLEYAVFVPKKPKCNLRYADVEISKSVWLIQWCLYCVAQGFGG